MATRLTFTPKQFASYVMRLGKDFVPAAVRGTQSAALRIIPLMVQRTTDAIPTGPRGSTGAVNTGLYKRSWKSSPQAWGVTVYNAQPYSSIIDYGRRASPVSKEGQVALAKWAMRKLQLSESEAKSAAFAIARALRKRAIPARKVMSGALEQMNTLAMEEITHELEKALAHR